MDSLTPFIRHELEHLPGTPAPSEAAGSRCSPPLGKQPPLATTDGTPVACRQKNAAEFLAGRSPGVMAQYGQGLFGLQQHTKSPHPAPEEDESGVLQLVEWREEAPYG